MQSSKVIVLGLLAVMLLSPAASAAVPGMMMYQGRLTDSAGNPIDTTVNITFRIYSDSVGGVNLWQETHSDVVVQDGLFEVMLAETVPLSTGVFDGSIRWLEISMGGGPVSDARVPIVSVAYAHRAVYADTAAYTVGGGGSNGWIDAGNTVSLETATDSVGIGTSDPEYPLDVQGSGIAIRGKSTGSGLIAVGVYGLHEGAGTGVLGSSSSGNGVYGFSTSGYAGYFQGNAYVAGKLGVHALNPEERLHVLDNGMGGNAYVKIQSTHASDWGETGLRLQTPQNLWHLRMDDDLNDDMPAGALSLRSEDLAAEVMTWDNNGNVGIGTTEPDYPLDVHYLGTAIRGRTTGGGSAAGVFGEGTGSGSGVKGASSSGYGVYGVSTTGFSGFFSGPKAYFSGSLGIGTQDPTHKLTVNGALAVQSGGDTKFHINYYNGGLNISETTVADYRLNIEAGGNVGIGTGNPQEKLHVNGNAKVDGTLTADAIYMSSLVDEPGIASAAVSISTDLPITSFIPLLKRRIEVPASGYILAWSTLEFTTYHDWQAASWVDAGISDDSTTLAGAHQYTYYLSDEVNSGYYGTPMSCQRLFYCPSQGEYEYYLVGRRRTANNPTTVLSRELDLIYIRTVYSSKEMEQISENGDPNESMDIHIASQLPLGTKTQEVSSSVESVDMMQTIQALSAEVEALRTRLQVLEEK